MQRQTQTQTVEVYEADYLTYARLVAVLWGIMSFPLVLLLRVALVQAVPDAAGALIGGWLAGPVGLAIACLAGLVNALVAVWAFNLAAGWGGGVRMTLRARQHVVAGQHELRAIGLWSAAVLGGLWGLFASQLLLLAVLTLLAIVMPMPDLKTGASIGLMAGMFALGGLLFGAANWFMSALIYNLLARLMGGVRFRMG